VDEGVIRAIGDRLQVMDGVQEGGRFDVAAVGDVTTDRCELERLLCPIQLEEKGGLDGLP
jgi:hypothetical protein